MHLKIETQPSIRNVKIINVFTVLPHSHPWPQNKWHSSPINSLLSRWGQFTLKTIDLLRLCFFPRFGHTLSSSFLQLPRIHHFWERHFQVLQQQFVANTRKNREGNGPFHHYRPLRPHLSVPASFRVVSPQILFLSHRHELFSERWYRGGLLAWKDKGDRGRMRGEKRKCDMHPDGQHITELLHIRMITFLCRSVLLGCIFGVLTDKWYSSADAIVMAISQVMQCSGNSTLAPSLLTLNFSLSRQALTQTHISAAYICIQLLSFKERTIIFNRFFCWN